MFTADIAIFHKQYVRTIIEVVDEFYIDSKKLYTIYEYFDESINYLQVRADDVLKTRESRYYDLEFFLQLEERSCLFDNIRRFRQRC